MTTFITTNSFAEAYNELLKQVFYNPEAVCKPRGMEVRELISPSIRVLDPTDRFYESPVRSTPMKYLAGEFMWYFSGRRDVEFISKFSSFWKQITNMDDASFVDDTTGYLLKKDEVNSSYGHLTMSVNDACWGNKPVSQWMWALNTLVRDPDSRQAIMHINRPGHQCEWVKDFPCTLSFQFFLRDNKVHMVAHMRSNDLIKGLTFDFPMFAFMHETFVSDLSALTLSGGEKYELGHLTLTANSSHIYDRDYETVEQMIDNLSSPGSMALGEAPVSHALDGTQSRSGQFMSLLGMTEATNDSDKEQHRSKLIGVYSVLGNAI